MSRKEILARYYEKNKKKILAKTAEWQRRPENRLIRNNRKIEKRLDENHKRREYDSNIKRRLKSPLKKLCNCTNSNQKRRFGEGNFYRLCAFDLWKIAKKQKNICPFTGEKLTTTNASLDHIIPVSKGGTNEPNNIRLVIKWVNLMRLNYTDEDFINMCKKIGNFRS